MWLKKNFCCDIISTFKEKAADYLKMTVAFFAQQPDFHLNCINVRYWDRYWFGKEKSYGDVFPHYWSALGGWSMYYYNNLKNPMRLKNTSKTI